MKNLKVPTIIMIFLSALFISVCDGLMTDGNYKSFERKLRGTWTSNDSGLYSGTLTITFDTITIDGYGEDWTSIMGDDSKRPFKDIPKRKPLKGYSEDGKIFIGYGEIAKDGIPYIYTEGGSYPKEYKLLEFTFGGRKEILECKLDF
jgi:hypothetical protein